MMSCFRTYSCKNYPTSTSSQVPVEQFAASRPPPVKHGLIPDPQMAAISRQWRSQSSSITASTSSLTGTVAT